VVAKRAIERPRWPRSHLDQAFAQLDTQSGPASHVNFPGQGKVLAEQPEHLPPVRPHVFNGTSSAGGVVGADADDGYLVRRAQEGYLDAYAELVDRHGQLAYRVALRLLGNHHDAEDVAQEALVAAWQQLPGFRGNSAYTTWLYQIVTRRALNRLTRTRAHDSLDQLGEVASTAEEPSRRAERNLTVDAVAAAVAALPPPQRVAIVLHHFEGLPNEEIARITGSTAPAVRSHLFRGRRTLTRTLQEWR
jgi:RNA polymerase sigma-70 factor (ECF subfamily)